MADTLAVKGEAINKVFEGVEQSIQDAMLTSIEFYGKEKSDSGNKIEDVVKVNKLRTSYNALVTFLITERLNKLNKNQKLFLTTGALADYVEIDGKRIELLDSALYSGLLENFDKKEQTVFSEAVFSTLDKMKALAEGRLELIDTSGKKKRSKTDGVDPKKKKAELEWKRNDAVKAGANLTRTLSPCFEKIAALDPAKLKSIKLNYDALVKYFNILQKGAKLNPEEKKLKDAFGPKIDPIAKMTLDFLKVYGEMFQRSTEGIVSLKEKFDEIKEKDEELVKVGLVAAAEENSKVDSFKSEHVDIIKRDISIINSFIVSAAEKHSNRVPFSGARIMLNSQIPDISKAMEHYVATPGKVVESLKKALSIHTNAFPLDDDGNYIIPPILIEPIRNYVDFLEDRFIMGVLSGEPGKKGANISFTPVDFQVMRAIGMYLAKDPIYDYRGEINEGTFMGDYTGKIEKKAQVKWTGEEKKMNMVMSAELVDAASRDDAVNNYMDFVYNVMNGLGPPPKMSKRRINILLRYATIVSVENNVKILLQYVAQSEPTEVRDTILKYTNRSYDTAKEMVRKIVKEDAMVQRVLGSNPDHIIARIFV
ncbi:MAG TPA: hypothetical protein ENN43_05570 [bacterium]|nr:hypothetical protein [bacterium]